MGNNCGIEIADDLLMNSPNSNGDLRRNRNRNDVGTAHGTIGQYFTKTFVS